MTRASPARLLLAFLAAVLLATVWGSIVQTQYNLSALTTIGADIGAGDWINATLRDIFSGFTPTYAGYIVLPSLLVAFAVAWWLAGRWGAAAVWFPLAGLVAIAAGNPIVNYLSPLALLVGATREESAIWVMALGGILAGLLFVWLAWPGHRRRRPANAAVTSDRPGVPPPVRR